MATSAPTAPNDQAVLAEIAKILNQLASQNPSISDEKTKPAKSYDDAGLVPRDRIELPTRGFSGRFEKDEDINDVAQLVWLELSAVAETGAIDGQTTSGIQNMIGRLRKEIETSSDDLIELRTMLTEASSLWSRT